MNIRKRLVTGRRAVEDLASSLIFPFFRKSAEKSILERWEAFGVECSNICNANCSFCGYNKKLDKREKGFVSFEVLRYALDLYDKAGGGNFSLSSILGDPLADKELIDKIKIAKEYHNIKGVSFYTNLIGLDNFDVEEFLKSGLTSVCISTAIGDSAMYKRLYGVDLYDRVIRNSLTLLEANKRLNGPVDISLLLRMDYTFFSKLKETPELKEIERYLRPENIITLDAAEWDDYNGTVSSFDLPIGARFKTDSKDKGIPCYALYRKLQILKDGSISVCACRVSPELIAGNIFNYKSLYDYWRGKDLSSFRRKWMEGCIPPVCKKCSHYMPYSRLLKGMLKDRIFRNVYKFLKT